MINGTGYVLVTLASSGSCSGGGDVEISTKDGNVLVKDQDGALYSNPDRLLGAYASLGDAPAADVSKDKLLVLTEDDGDIKKGIYSSNGADWGIELELISDTDSNDSNEGTADGGKLLGSYVGNINDTESETITFSEECSTPNLSVYERVTQDGQISDDLKGANFTIQDSAYQLDITPVDGKLVLSDSGEFTEADVGKKITGNGGVVFLSNTDGTYQVKIDFDTQDTIPAGDWKMHALEVTVSGIKMNSYVKPGVVKDSFRNVVSDVEQSPYTTILARFGSGRILSYFGSNSRADFNILDQDLNIKATIIDLVKVYSNTSLTAVTIPNGNIAIIYSKDDVDTKHITVVDDEGGVVLDPVEINTDESHRYFNSILMDSGYILLTYQYNDYTYGMTIDTDGTTIIDPERCFTDDRNKPGLCKMPNGDILAIASDDSNKLRLTCFDKDGDRVIYSRDLGKKSYENYWGVAAIPTDNPDVVNIIFTDHDNSDTPSLLTHDYNNDTDIAYVQDLLDSLCEYGISVTRTNDGNMLVDASDDSSGVHSAIFTMEGERLGNVYNTITDVKNVNQVKTLLYGNTAFVSVTSATDEVIITKIKTDSPEFTSQTAVGVGTIQTSSWTEITDIDVTDTSNGEVVAYAIKTNDDAYQVLDNDDGIRNAVRLYNGVWQWNKATDYSSEEWEDAVINSIDGAFEDALSENNNNMGASQLRNLDPDKHEVPGDTLTMAVIMKSYGRHTPVYDKTVITYNGDPAYKLITGETDLLLLDNWSARFTAARDGYYKFYARS